MLSSLAKLVVRRQGLTSASRRGIHYKIVAQPTVPTGPRLPLYRSNQLGFLADTNPESEGFINDLFNNKSAHYKYLRLIPFFLEKLWGRHRKNFVVKLELSPDEGYLILDCLDTAGIARKYVSVRNFVPMIFDDYRAANRRVLFQTPPFVDTELVYYNPLTQEFYIFDREATWNDQNVNHPALDVSKLFDEKLWLDQFRVI